MKIAIFCNIALYILYMNRCFGGTYRLHLQGRKSSEQEITRRCIPEDKIFHNYRCENLKSYIETTVLLKRQFTFTGQYTITAFVSEVSV
jgi:hypothetical protein